MAASLFRLEAVEYQRSSAWAGVTIAPPLSTWLLTAFLAASIACAISFLSLGTYARKETVTGYLTPAAGVANVLPSASGVVAQLYVADGDTVRAGQRLLLIRSERRDTQDQGVDALIIDRLQAKRDITAKRIGIERQAAGAQRQSLSDAIAGLEAEVVSLSESLRTQRDRLKIAHDNVESVRPTVERGITSMTEFRRRLDNELSQQQAQTELYRRISAKAVEVREKRQALAELEARTADNIAVLQAAVADTDAGLAEAQSKQGYIISASAPGRITSLQAWVGVTAVMGIPLMSIVPESAPLEAALLVPAKAIGFVAPGQTISLTFDPFPFQRFGFYNATVVSVSATQMKPNEVVGPLTPKEPSYRVVARLGRQLVTAYGNVIPLRPDMTLKADIVFDRRSLIEWLFDPLLSARGRIQLADMRAGE